MNAPLTITHSRGEYVVQFAPLAEAIASLPGGSVVITDTNVAAAWSHALPNHRPLVVPAGESSKSLAIFGELLESLAERGLKRGGTVVALGGGVIGDLAGFVAAAYMRGVRFVQIPTTLLAQVDSSVGGKVGIDLRHGKNLAGAFHPPSAVWVCPETLATLPDRQWRNGLAEVYKTAFIAEEDLLSRAESLNSRPSPETTATIVRRCIAIKAAVVQADEFETTGQRAILNFGHTIGHAIEHESLFAMLHGEAIAIGMVLEAKLGECMGVTQTGTADRVARALATIPLPSALPAGIGAEALMLRMQQDKKATASGLAFSLLESVGACKLCDDVPESLIREVLKTE